MTHALTYAVHFLYRCYYDRLRFEVPSQGVTIASLFRLMESNQAALKLEDYSISQTSLEQVFNGHAAEEDQRKKEMMKMAQRVKFF